MKRNGDSIDTIKLTLRRYKHSNPAEPVNIFIYQAQPVCPVSLILAYLNLRTFAPKNFPHTDFFKTLTNGRK